MYHRAFRERKRLAKVSLDVIARYEVVEMKLTTNNFDNAGKHLA